MWNKIDDPGFKFVSIERLTEGDEALVKATYQLNPQRLVWTMAVDAWCRADCRSCRHISNAPSLKHVNTKYEIPLMSGN